MIATTMFVPLVGEGTQVWRPVQASPLGVNSYVLQGHVPSGEQWQFQPGSIVRCEQRVFQDGSRGLIAVEELNA